MPGWEEKAGTPPEPWGAEDSVFTVGGECAITSLQGAVD